MRNINRPANSFTVTGDAEYKHAGNKVSLALCPLSRGLIFLGGGYWWNIFRDMYIL